VELPPADGSKRLTFLPAVYERAYERAAVLTSKLRERDSASVDPILRAKKPKTWPQPRPVQRRKVALDQGATSRDDKANVSAASKAATSQLTSSCGPFDAGCRRIPLSWGLAGTL